jgi:hypothetical protein
MNDIFIFNTPIIHVRFASNFALEKISHLLQDKGMNPEIAIVRAQAVFKEVDKASLYFHNFQHFFDKEIMQKIYAYVSKKALFQEKISFGSYDQMLGMMQSVYKTNLSEVELKQIKHLSQANRYAIALIR